MFPLSIRFVIFKLFDQRPVSLSNCKSSDPGSKNDFTKLKSVFDYLPIRRPLISLANLTDFATFLKFLHLKILHF